MERHGSVSIGSNLKYYAPVDGCGAGFRLDPPEQLERVHQELSSLHQVHAADPILGVDFEEEETVSTAYDSLDAQRGTFDGW